MKEFRFGKELKLPKELRKELRKVHGRLVNQKDLHKLLTPRANICAVGDATVEALLAAGIRPRISIFDYRVGRKDFRSQAISKAFPKPLKARNRRGTISKGLWLCINKALARGGSTGIRVYGEEDLASVACAYLAPKGALLLYGLPGRGIIMVRITPDMRRKALGILERMKQ